MPATEKCAARPMTIVDRGSADTEPTEGPDRCFLDDPTPTAGDAASLCGPADHARSQRVVEEEKLRRARRDADSANSGMEDTQEGRLRTRGSPNGYATRIKSSRDQCRAVRGRGSWSAAFRRPQFKHANTMIASPAFKSTARSGNIVPRHLSQVFMSALYHRVKWKPIHLKYWVKGVFATK